MGGGEACAQRADTARADDRDAELLAFDVAPFRLRLLSRSSAIAAAAGLGYSALIPALTEFLPFVIRFAGITLS